jgi:cation diffusion facilitator CzcD-associated flavoprotein CzcO
MSDRREVIVVGGGQGGLAIGYLLAQQGRRFTILEAADTPAPRGASAGTRCGCSRRSATTASRAGRSPGIRTATRVATTSSHT